jgi:uncharacterized protein (TIGR02147 family)
MEELATSRDYRHLLQGELSKRAAQNPHYSLRAFARDLGLAPSRLSEILNGKQGLSRLTAERVGARLGLSEDERAVFCDLVESRHARSAADKKAAALRLTKRQYATPEYQFKIDAFHVISDWYHLAIVELVTVSGFKNDAKWIARKLTITEIQVKLAIERLIRLKFLKLTRGKLVLLKDEGFVPNDVPSESVRKFHQQILERAISALHAQNVSERHIATHVFAFDKKRMAEAKKSMRRFEHRFCKKLEGSRAKDSVYCLSFQFFDLTKGQSGS